ncbi:alpha/beta hydrolase [Marivita sp. XM-24bin2]|uniref:alpha/beta fold hydrolase n=1 Tax=Marivita sp. XM-24bin2 TaxID=2133951 RepID=UPI000D7B191F|nr:alpha/beta hydrolase [Marivita sp. XM-24bin2]PWL35998.1 MAG: alpha/beta hydrolase [Marivita sp. XM-24bin2]
MTLKGFGVLLGCAAALVLTTACTASYREAKAEERFPPVGDFLNVNGTQVHYVTKGTGPDIVLIHGASGNLRDFTFSLVDKLADRYRVTAFDRPGLGYTERVNPNGTTLIEQAHLLADATEQLGLQSPMVLGHSYGGAVALAWAVERPDSLSALILLAAASNPWSSDLSLYYKVTSSDVGSAVVVPALTAFVPNPVVDRAIEDVFEPQSEPPGYAEHIGAPLTLRRDTMRANAMQRANLLDEIKALHTRYGAIDVPTEIVHGDADTTVGLSIHSIPPTNQIIGANLTVLEGIGHMPHHAAEPEVIAAIDRAEERAGLR